MTAAVAAPPSRRGFDALFDPRGVIVAGASSHPGKFGFVVLHNILSHGYAGRVFATNRDAAARGRSLLGLPVLASVEEVPQGAADLVFVCTPVDDNVGLLRACAARGVQAAFVMTAGYGETGESGRRAEAELAAAAAELGVLLAGPNGQGVVSTPSSLCAQMVAPYPPPGPIAVASQSGNIVSSVENLARHSGIGLSRGVSAGNAAAVGVVDFLEYFAHDPATAVSLAYLEGIDDGRARYEQLRAAASVKPVVMVKGGATAAGGRAAASHTGALATDDRVFAGACRQAGVTLAATVDEAYDAAATFATQPLPSGPDTLVVTTAGGWGVLTADAISRSRLQLVELPADLRAAIDDRLPPRWSRANPVDLAASETRDTIPEVLELAAAHPDVHAIVFLGLGVQSNQARVLREGRFAGDEGVDRIATFHERQDERYARVAAEVSQATGTPILCATELSVSDPDNPGPRAVRASGRYCAPSPHRAVRALEHLWDRAQRRARRAA